MALTINYKKCSSETHIKNGKLSKAAGKIEQQPWSGVFKFVGVVKYWSLIQQVGRSVDKGGEVMDHHHWPLFSSGQYSSAKQKSNSKINYYVIKHSHFLYFSTKTNFISGSK